LRKLIVSPRKALNKIAGEAMREVGCPLDPKTFHNEIRPVFRTVSHFWAAFIALADCDPAFPFPCPTARLGEFLAAAEFFRLKGETAKIPGTKKMFIREGEAFRLPPNLAVKLLVDEKDSIIAGHGRVLGGARYSRGSFKPS
jgi:hypothetical protein